MDNEVLAAIVTALGSVLAAAVGVAGVYAILKHRRKVKLLSQQVEAYYHHEGQLVREIYRLETNSAQLSESQLPAQRRRLRDRLASAHERPSMTAAKAIQFRDQIL